MHQHEKEKPDVKKKKGTGGKVKKPTFEWLTPLGKSVIKKNASLIVW